MAEQEHDTPNTEPTSTPETPEAAPALGLDLATRVAELEAQIKDTQLRAQAEIQNIHRRAERDADNARKYALEKFAGSLLDVVDNLERALDAAAADNEAAKTLREGVVLTHKQLIDTLKRFGVEQTNPVGEPFNAELHQAVSMQPSTSAEPNSVTAVLAKGYTLSGRLLRPAMVVVATAG